MTVCAERRITLGIHSGRNVWMPVTARLSRAFYDRLGDEVVNELVSLLNLMDTSYVSELRQQNEMNYARFDAKLDQRFAEQNAKFEKRFAAVDRRFVELEAKVDLRFAVVDQRFSELDAKWERRLTAHRDSLLRWMAGLWLAGMIGLAGLFARMG
jgi:hypothetical protein